MPTDVGHSKNGTFKYLRDRVWEKVKGWMEKLLSAAGKEVLIKAVAQAIPVYSMSCFRLPRGLCDSISSIIRQFDVCVGGGVSKASENQVGLPGIL